MTDTDGWKGYILPQSIVIIVGRLSVNDPPNMAHCNHCGAHVSGRFARVFADEHGRVFACPGCSANAGIAEAAKKRTKNT